MLTHAAEAVEANWQDDELFEKAPGRAAKWALALDMEVHRKLRQCLASCLGMTAESTTEIGLQVDDMYESLSLFAQDLVLDYPTVELKASTQLMDIDAAKLGGTRGHMAKCLAEHAHVRHRFQGNVFN